MASNNPFEVLANKTPSWTVKSDQTEEYASQKHGFRALAGDSVLNIGEAFGEGFPITRVQLLAVSHDKYAYATVDNRICVGSLSQLKAKLETLTEKGYQTEGNLFDPEKEITVEAAISHLAFSSDASKLYISAMDGGLLICSTDSLQGSQQQVGSSALIDLSPNPVDSTVALLNRSGQLQLYSDNGITDIASDVSAISWSKRGKQIIAGTNSGILRQYTPKGELKAELSAVNDEVGKVNAINWLENDLFVIAYENNDKEIAIYILRRDQSGESATLTYTGIPNPSISFGDTSHEAHFSFAALSKDLVVTMSSVSADFGLISLSHNAAIDIDVEEQKAAVRFSSNRDTDVSIIGYGVQIDAEQSAKYVWYADNDGGCAAWQVLDSENPLFDTAAASVKSVGSSPFATQIPSPSPFGQSAVAGFNHSGIASPFSFTSSGSTPAPMFGGIAALPAPAKSTNQPAFGASNSFGSSAFGSTTFGTSAFAAPTAFKGFGNTVKSGKTNDAVRASTATSSNNMPSKTFHQGTMSDSEEDEMRDDKLAQLDEQEPKDFNGTMAIEDSASMNFLSVDQHDESDKKGEMEKLTASPVPIKDVEATSGDNVETKESSSSAFGKFSFPTAQSGGFGHQASPFAKTERSEISSIAPSQIPRPQVPTSKPSFGFGEFVKTHSSASPVKSAFVFGDGSASFGFGSTTAPVAVPEIEVKSSAVGEQPYDQLVTESTTSSLPSDQLVNETTAKQTEGFSGLGTEKLKGSADLTATSTQTLESRVEPFEASQDSSKSDDDTLKGVPPLNFAEASIDQQHDEDKAVHPELTVNASADTKTADNDVKHIPPFDFSHVAEQEAPVVKVETDADSPEATTTASLVSEEAQDEPESAPFASFSIEEHDSEYETEDEDDNDNEGEDEDEEESSELLELASRADGDEFYGSHVSDQSGAEDGSDEGADSQLEQSDEPDTGSIFSDVESDAGSAFKPKTPAFASTTKGDSSRPSPFASSPFGSPFGGQSSKSTTKEPQTMFNFAHAAKLSDSDTTKSSAKAPAFSFHPEPAPSTFSFSPTLTGASPLSRESQKVDNSSTLSFNRDNTGDQDQKGKESSSKLHQSSGSSGSKGKIIDSKLSTDAEFKLPQRSSDEVTATKEFPTQQLPQRSSSDVQRSADDATQQTVSQPQKMSQTSAAPPSVSIQHKQEPETLQMPDYVALGSKEIESDNETGIAHELHVLSTTLSSELDVMRDNLERMSSYIQKAQSMPESVQHVHHLSSDVAVMLEQAQAYVKDQTRNDSQLSIMRSSMLRLEAQKTKVQRLLRAQTDTSFAKTLKFSALGPEHAAQQKQIRQLLGNVEKDLSKLQSSLSMIKAKNTSFEPQTSVPTAETITRATAKIMQVAAQKERDVDNLQKAFVSLQVASPDASFQSASYLGHRSRRSQARFSVDNTFDLSLSRLSLSQSGAGPSRGLEKTHNGNDRSSLMARAEQKRHAMQVYREARAKGQPVKTVPM